MATPIPCDTCGQPNATAILTIQESGETAGYCAACLARFGLDLAKATLPAEEIMEQLGPIFVEVSQAQGGPKRARKGRKEEPAEEPEPEAGSPPAEALEEEPATAQDA